MMEIVDNASRKNWSIPMKSKDKAIPQLQKFKLREELQTGKKIKRTRTDNAPELMKLLQEWKQTSGVVPEYTTIAISNQNGIAERSIQTSEKTMRAMIKNACLPIEFWDEAAETSAYIRNRIPIGPIVEGKRTSPEQVYTGEKPRVDHIRVWGSKCYSYVNPKTLPAKGRHDKLVDRGRVGVFMGYSLTDKQMKVYAPDLGYTIRTSVVCVDEETIGGSIDLKIRIPSSPQGTPNTLVDRKRRGRPRLVDHIPEDQTENAHTEPLVDGSANGEEVPNEAIHEEEVLQAINHEEEVLQEINHEEKVLQEINHEYETILPSTEAQPSTETIPTAQEPSIFREDDSQNRYFLRKRKRDKDEDDPEEGHREKVIRAMIAMNITPGQSFNAEVVNIPHLIDLISNKR
jgi:hypothetical protein